MCDVPSCPSCRPAKREELNNKQCPLSYKRNCQKEKLLIALAENFRRQFTHLYPDRKPLFLSPLNECGVEVHTHTHTTIHQDQYYHTVVLQSLSEAKTSQTGFTSMFTPGEREEKSERESERGRVIERE